MASAVSTALPGFLGALGERPQADQQTVRAELLRRIFGSDDPARPFQVWAVRDPSTGSDFTAKGSFAGWGDPGDGVVLTGAWVDDPRYGRQFAAEALVPDLPEPGSVACRAAWMARQKGIGRVTARQAAQAVGDGGIDALAGDPEALGAATWRGSASSCPTGWPRLWG